MTRKSLIKLMMVIGIIVIGGLLIRAYFVDEEKANLLISQSEGEKAITIAAVNSGAPYLYRSGSGEEIGYNADVLALLSEKLNVKFVFIDVAFDTAMEMLNNHEIDLILGLQYNPDYVDSIKYSKPFIENESSVFVKASSRGINGFGDLEGKKVAVYKNDPSYSYLSSLSGIRIFKTESLEDAAMMLRYGTVDAWVGNYRESILLLKNSNFEGTIKIVGKGVELFPSAIAANKSQVELIQLINVGIDSIKDSDELSEIENKWFGEIIEGDNTNLKHYLYIAVGTVVSLAIIVVIIARINKLLKREVDRRTAEIEHRKKMSEGMLQSLSEGIITIDSEKKIIFINDKVLELIHMESLEKCIGKNIEETALKDIIYVYHLEQCLKDREKVIGAERRFKLSNLDSKIYEYNITPILLPLSDGLTVPGATIAIRDNTENIVLKERMIKIDKLQSIGRMTAEVAHELRNPLTSMDMYIKLLPQKYSNESFRTLMIEDLSSEIKRMNAIVDNLLDLSKVNKPKVETFNLSREITGIIRLVKLQPNMSKLDFVQEIDKHIQIHFDKNQFAQVCVNILSNAVEKLESEKEGQIKVSAKVVDHVVRLYFEDSGDAIPKDIIESIFEPFYTTKDKGNGLGLSIVYELVSKNNGTIRAYNSAQNRPTFALDLKGELMYG
ncbi:transporter substrate-binding domain-containing protein [Fusibacter ferrireducens]|uniref:histidine kinase n=1 Tax=Fusibacter ferrireducens TaxID=2785058 RepID=A0ABR9ZWW8_9FIRM|nr:transporter substrate-binding domain-containing protein [Fusibacter ferrireducens]MBF4694949.1 transporter substrate-binding domain-containing protein [Fusibacter ferrireducens]